MFLLGLIIKTINCAFISDGGPLGLMCVLEENCFQLKPCKGSVDQAKDDKRNNSKIRKYLMMNAMNGAMTMAKPMEDCPLKTKLSSIGLVLSSDD